jgi:dTDP-glucose 4,6-dehydratase
MDVILVTGGSGFIGSHFIRHLLDAELGFLIINLDRLTYAGNPANVQDCATNPRYRFIHGDIADTKLVKRIVREGVRAIFNFAAESHVDRSIRDARPFLETNVLGTQVLLDAARTFGVERFIQISTDEVYGSLGPTGAFTEDSPLTPNSPYAASKASADLLVRSYVQTYQTPALLTRASNNYGPCQYPEKLIPLFIGRLLRDEPVPVYGDGLQVRDWLHVRDHCTAIHRVWRQGRVGEVYNVGGRCEKTNLELTEALLDLCGKPRSLIRFVADRPGHDRRYALDCTKIERELGWKPRMKFEEGLARTVKWYRENRAWVEGVHQRAA